MRNNKFFLLSVLVLLICSIGCQQEINFETNIPSRGSLKDSTNGDCLPKTINGTYSAGTALSVASNTITVQVNISQTGTYTISTDTVNGYSFRATGIFSVPGPATVTLRGSGTPVIPGTDNFVVKYDTSVCNIAVTVLTGTSSPAVFTLAGAGGTCTAAVVAGNYATATPLNSTNTVTINVNVTTPGSYSLTTTFQGMTFSGSGVFTTTGANTIILTGSGTPTTAGANTVPITVGTASCSFVVTVGSPAVYTMDCSTAVISGTYQVGNSFEFI